ncbi:MATE family efflux transporter [Cellulosilyticum sp. I15G10I2]|uniref:MATE family efflux transporter n=1 Tax=Cellulosilyticum sp. I15G10I2 TaxID=1892843 RepID=UPI00085CC044|nr:MATE family efflux transporter [Cellulosilyticum sp. I15G10I2]
MKKIDLTEGNIVKVIIALALPIMGSSFLQLTYNLVDMIWVGRLGSDAVASIGSSGFFIALGYAINALVITGTGIKVAHEVGRKDDAAVEEYMNAGIILNVIISVGYGAILLVFGKVFIGFLKLGDHAIERDAYLYLLMNIPILFFSFFNMLYVRVLGSFGNTKAALNISAIGLILNIILDPILIYGLELGILGAAIATLFANSVMFIVFNVKGKDFFKYRKKVGTKYARMKEIIRLGIPMATQRILFTLVGIVLARIIARFGPGAIAAQKIGFQIESIGLMVTSGLSGAVASFVGQNYGAKKYKRINKGYDAAFTMGVLYSSVMAVIVLSIPETLVSIFVKEQNTIAIASEYLKIVGVTQIFGTIEMVSNGTFTGLGLPKIPATISIIFTMLRIPLAMLFAPLWGLTGIWLSITVSSVLKGVSAYLIYKFKVWKEYKDALSV